MRVFLAILLLCGVVACTGPRDDDGDDDDDDDGGTHHQNFVLDVTLIDRDDQPVSGAIVATSVDQELVGVSQPTDSDGHTQVDARLGSLITAYGPATLIRRVRFTSLVSSTAPLTLRSVWMLPYGSELQAEVTGLSPGDRACILDDAGQKQGVANTSGVFAAVPLFGQSSLESDGEATVIAMAEYCSGNATQWGASRDNALDSVAQLTLATDLSTLTPTITVDVQNAGEYGSLAARYYGQHVQLFHFGYASVSSSASVVLSAPGRDIADSLRLSAGDVGDDGLGNSWLWQFPIAGVPTDFMADLSDLSFHLVAAEFVVTGTSGTLQLEVDGGADAVSAILLSFGPAQSAWEVLLPAAEAATWSISAPPVPPGLADDFPLMESPQFGYARVIDVDFVDSPEDLWRIRSRRTPAAFDARFTGKQFGPGLVFDFVP